MFEAKRFQLNSYRKAKAKNKKKVIIQVFHYPIPIRDSTILKYFFIHVERTVCALVGIQIGSVGAL